jgi:RND superfamily putative drug exporter
MFRLLGKSVTRFWPFILVVWVIALVALMLTAPPWHTVIDEGEFAFLPDDMPSLMGESVYEDSWGEPFASNIVIVLWRERHELEFEDREFITSVLSVEVKKIIDEVGIPQPLKSETADDADPPVSDDTKADDGDTATDEDSDDVDDDDKQDANPVKTFESPSWTKILDSETGKATMVLIELPTEFFDARNTELIDRIEELITANGILYSRTKEIDGRRVPVVPPGLKLALSGSATVGRDLMRAATESSQATELWTVILVVTLLVVIYRAPILALIPLATVGLATEFSLALLATLAKHNIVGLFNGIEVYVKVLCYGAGVDYCLFLIARFKEELDVGVEPPAAVSNAIAKVGDALVASAGTVICGIGMMVFADFGKFRQAGIAISVGLAIVLIAALTFTPALLRLTGRWSFWPHVPTKKLQDTAGWVSATGLMSSALRRNIFESIWEKTGELIRRRPGYVLALTTTLMMPFAIVAVLCFKNLSYGLLSELPPENASVEGAKAIQSAGRYPAGIAGPVTLLIYNPNEDFTDPDSKEKIGRIVEQLFKQNDELLLAEIRDVKHPYGITLGGDGLDPPEGMSAFEKITFGALRKVAETKINERYVGQQGDRASHITMIDFISTNDPFTRDSIGQFDDLKDAVLQTALKSLNSPGSTQIFAIGPTASIKDLKTVTDRDQIVVDALVLVVVFLILLILLRQLTVSAYLIATVFFSYLVTLGATFTVFYLMDPSGFAGLDWKVPTFLFTILIAVGEDYNIFLMTRVREEQIEHGPVDGVIVALKKTGSIISSCGVIMAGTFASLLAGTLVGMHQLGFALMFGVLLDTFVVRPILVPAFLVLLYQGRLRFIGQLIGLSPTPSEDDPDAPAVEPQS